MTVDLRQGRWEEALLDVDEVDAVITDPPYSNRVHRGHDAGANHANRVDSDSIRQEISYAAWLPDEARCFALHWAERTRGWICIQSCHELAPHYAEALREAGWYVFAPVPLVIRGMTVRMAGDGPSSWCVWMTVARRKTREMSSWGTLPGAYITTRGADYIGGKPLYLMSAIVGDYTRPGDLVCDPCAGLATTAVACSQMGRDFIGAEVNPETHRVALDRLSGPAQMEMFV